MVCCAGAMLCRVLYIVLCICCVWRVRHVSVLLRRLVSRKFPNEKWLIRLKIKIKIEPTHRRRRRKKSSKKRGKKNSFETKETQRETEGSETEQAGKIFLEDMKRRQMVGLVSQVQYSTLYYIQHTPHIQ